MSAPANVIVLAEDDHARNLLRRYVERVLGVREPRTRSFRAPSGGGDAKRYILERYIAEVREFRSAHASRCLLLHIDADRSSLAYRQQQLADALKTAGLAPRAPDERIVHVVMARHVETWLAALTGKLVDPDGNPLNEDYDCKRNHFPREPNGLIKDAVEALYSFTRPNAAPAPLTSITAAIPELRRLET